MVQSSLQLVDQPDAAANAGRCSAALTYVQDSEDEELDHVLPPLPLHAAAPLNNEAVSANHAPPAKFFDSQAAISSDRPIATEADLTSSQLVLPSPSHAVCNLMARCVMLACQENVPEPQSCIVVGLQL